MMKQYCPMQSDSLQVLATQQRQLFDLVLGVNSEYAAFYI